MRESLKKVWDNGYGKLGNNNPFEQWGANKASGGTHGDKKKPVHSSKKTETGKPITKVEVNPKV